MKKMTLLTLVFLGSCAENPVRVTEVKLAPQIRPKKVLSTKKVKENKEIKKTLSRDVSGTLANGTLFEAMPDSDGYVVSFDPTFPKKDAIFIGVVSQLIAKIYTDKISDESHISIETDIGYTIFKGKNTRYKIVPYFETNGEISSLEITTLL